MEAEEALSKRNFLFLIIALLAVLLFTFTASGEFLGTGAFGSIASNFYIISVAAAPIFLIGGLGVLFQYFGHSILKWKLLRSANKKAFILFCIIIIMFFKLLSML